ncbi:hypothetical protein OK016_29160 [Vibrio chagasii]|nr:hypothetical protein [Vibrio chagasii]
MVEHRWRKVEFYLEVFVLDLSRISSDQRQWNLTTHQETQRSPDIAVKLGSASTDIMPFVATASISAVMLGLLPAADIRQFRE